MENIYIKENDKKNDIHFFCILFHNKIQTQGHTRDAASYHLYTFHTLKFVSQFFFLF